MLAQTVRRIAPSARFAQQARSMHKVKHIPREKAFIPSIVSYVNAEDQGVFAGLLIYGSIAFAISCIPGKEKTIEAPSTSSGDDIPSIESPEFEAWISAEGNAEKLFDKLANMN